MASSMLAEGPLGKNVIGKHIIELLMAMSSLRALISGPFIRNSCIAPANSFCRGLQNNQHSLKFHTIVLNYIYIILAQQKAMGSVSILCHKGFQAGAETQIIALEFNDVHSSYLRSNNRIWKIKNWTI